MAEVTDGEALRGRLVVLGDEHPILPTVEACIYRVAQEAINNVAKHSGARYFRVALRFEDDGVDLAVEDNGRGFDVGEAETESDEGKTMGLANMRQRIEAEGGTLTVASKPYSGTSICAWLPTPSVEEPA